MAEIQQCVTRIMTMCPRPGVIRTAGSGCLIMGLTWDVAGEGRSGPWFNIKMTYYQYRKSHCGDKMVVRSSYLHSGISYTGKMTSLYWIGALDCTMPIRPLFQYPIRCLIVRSREVSKQWDLYLELSDSTEIWQAHRQHCCRSACQISKLCNNLNSQSRSFEFLW